MSIHFDDKERFLRDFDPVMAPFLQAPRSSGAGVQEPTPGEVLRDVPDPTIAAER